MLIEKIKEEELEFYETLCDPIALNECMFSNADNLADFNEKFIDIRPGQPPMLSFEYLLDEDPNLTEKENFTMREHAGSIYSFSGRLIGKTWAIEELDLCSYTIHGKNERAGFTSFDAFHIKGVWEKVIPAWDFHPILSFFVRRLIRSPYSLVTKRGLSIEGINMNLVTGARAGDQFFQKHFKKLYIEEGGKENQIVFDKRVDSRHELGCVERVSGMTNITGSSPAGKTMKIKPKELVMNAPQYINPNFDEKTKEEAIVKYGGEQSIGYKVFVEAEIISEGISALDMERIRRLCYPHKKDGSLDEKNTIKNFEIDKEHFGRYASLLVVERPVNADKLVICADVGNLGGTSEFIVLSEINKKWRYLYNITFRNLATKEQYLISKYLIKRLTPNYIAVDATDAGGRDLSDDLWDDKELNLKKEQIIRVGFNENIEVGIEKDSEGKPIREAGKVIKKFENTTVWSVQKLCELLYDGKIFLPLDYKLDEQLDSVIAVSRGNTISYECATTENHLWQAFQVFAILHFLIEYSGYSKAENEAKNTFGFVGA